MSRLFALVALIVAALSPAAATAQSGGNVDWMSWWIRLDTTPERCSQMSEQALKSMGYKTQRYGTGTFYVDGLHPTAPLRIEAICESPTYVHVFAARYPSGEITPNGEIQKFTANMKALLAGQTLPAPPAITAGSPAYPRVSVGWTKVTGTQGDCVANSDAAMKRLGYTTLANPQATWVGVVGTTSDGGSVMTRCDAAGQMAIYSAVTPSSTRDTASMHRQLVAELTKPPATAGAGAGAPTKPAPGASGDKAAPGSTLTPEKLQAALVGQLNDPKYQHQLYVFDIGPDDASPVKEIGLLKIKSARALRQCVVEVSGDYYPRDPSRGYAGAAPRPGTVVLDLKAFDGADLNGDWDGAMMADDETQRGYNLVGLDADEGFLVGKAVQVLWNACG